MKKTIKTVFQYSLIVIILMLAVTQVNALDVKKSKILFQEPYTFVAWVFDEKGDKMEGAIARIKGREDKPLDMYQTSSKLTPIVVLDYPTNAIIVISKPGYVTQEIDTRKLYKRKDSTPKEFDKALVKVKMIPVKKGGKQTTVQKNKA